jgi:hypothetical protein
VVVVVLIGSVVVGTAVDVGGAAAVVGAALGCETPQAAAKASPPRARLTRTGRHIQSICHRPRAQYAVGL